MYPRFVPGNTHMFPNTLLAEDVEKDKKRVGEHVGTCGGNVGEHFPFRIKNPVFWQYPAF